MNIYELKSNYMKLQQLAESGEFDLEAINEAMEQIDEDMEQKAEGYGLVMTNLQSDSDALKNEIARLNERKKAIDKNVSRMKENLSEALLLSEKTKFKTDHFSFSFRKSETVVIEKDALLSSDYLTIKTTQTPNKTAIKKALKDGEIIEGATIQTNQNLQIK